MAVTYIANAQNFVWGIPAGQTVATIGRNVSVSQNRTADTEELKTIDGETDGLVLLDKGSELSIEAIIPASDASQIDAAGTLTWNGTTFVVLAVKRDWQQRGWARISVSLRAWDAMPIS